MLDGVKGVSVLNETFFNEFTVKLPGDAAAITEKMAKKGVLAGVPVSRLLPGDKKVANLLIVANTEVNTDADREAFVKTLKAVL
jgi:glycine dehydrogenase subunit 1